MPNPKFSEHSTQYSEISALAVYKERPQYHPDQIKSLGDLAVGDVVWRVHPGWYTSQPAKYDHAYAPEVVATAPKLIWTNGAYLEPLQIIAVGKRVREESAAGTFSDRLPKVWIPDPNAFFAEGEAHSGRGMQQNQKGRGIATLSLTAADVGIQPFINSAGEERWSTVYLRPVKTWESTQPASSPIHVRRFSQQEIVDNVAGTEFLT